MARKLAVIAVAFDDPENNIQDSAEMATWVEAALGRSQAGAGLDVTVYSTPEALALDTAEGHSVFSEGKEGAPVPRHDHPEAAPGV